jgi:hypothetical protein
MTFNEMHEVVKNKSEYAHIRNCFKRTEDYLKRNIYVQDRSGVDKIVNEARAEFDKVKVKKKIIDNQMKLL